MHVGPRAVAIEGPKGEREVGGNDGRLRKEKGVKVARVVVHHAPLGDANVARRAVEGASLGRGVKVQVGIDCPARPADKGKRRPAPRLRRHPEQAKDLQKVQQCQHLLAPKEA